MRDSFAVGKGAGREVNHTPPSSTKAKNDWTHTFVPPIRPHSMDWENYLLITETECVYCDVRTGFLYTIQAGVSL